MNSKNVSSTIKQIMGQAISSKARRFTYCLIDDTSETKVGTAVAIKLGNRFFLATAAHVIKKAQSIKVVVRDQVRTHLSYFKNKHFEDCSDVGMLEIMPSDSHRFDFLSQHLLYKNIDDEEKLPAMVVGFPGQFCKAGKEIDLTIESIVRIVYCNTLTFHTLVVPRSKWPSEGLPDEDGMYKKLVDGRDMLIDFEPEPEVIPFRPQSTGTENPPVECKSLDPHGMSGGGIWLAQVKEGKENIESPDARLIGLQTGWHPSKNLLHGIRIGVWLDVVRNKYPDLRNIVL